MFHHKSLLSASPSSFGSRYERTSKLSPNVFGSSVEDISSRRSSVELTGNNAVSFSSSCPTRPPLCKESTVKNRPTPTIGFIESPLREEGTATSPETLNNSLGVGRPGLLSLSLREDVHRPGVQRNSIERELRLADRFSEDSKQPWSLQRLQEVYPIFRHAVVVEAYELAAGAHAGQLRKNGEPVLVHCVETAKILADINADEHIIAAALLHDVVDDTCLTFSQLQSMIVSDVCDLVKKVSKLSYMSQLVRHGDASLTDLAKLKDVLIASVDCRAVLIKMADRIHNMRTASVLSLKKQTHWAQETMDLFVPLAGRLGCWGIKSEMEDLCFAILHPQAYAKLKATYDVKVAWFTDEHLQGLLNELKVALDEQGIQYEDISGRPKGLYGIYSKMQRKGYEDMEQVLDVFALRIVLKDGQSCHDALDSIRDLWPTVPGKLKDYIAHPKPNGYRSIHNVCLVNDVPLEVQIRTTKMHYIAEHGIAAHWRYKETNAADMNAFVEQRTLWSRYVLNWVFFLNDKKLRPDDLQESSAICHYIWNAFWSFKENDKNTIPCQHSGWRPCSVTWCPVHVVVKDMDSVQVCDTAPRTTLEAFLLEHCGILKSDGRIPMVNGDVAVPTYVLQFGDLIEFSDVANISHHSSAQQSMIVPFESCRDPVLPHCRDDAVHP